MISFCNNSVSCLLYMACVMLRRFVHIEMKHLNNFFLSVHVLNLNLFFTQDIVRYLFIQKVNPIILFVHIKDMTSFCMRFDPTNNLHVFTGP